MKEKIKLIEELVPLVAELKEENKTIVATSGCFDILHAGHITYLEEAKTYGDILIVMLNSDCSVRNLKGEGRPIVPEKERAVVLSGLQSIDYICIFNERTPCEKYRLYKPDIIVKGGGL